jgi:hypothetical protein
MGVQVAFSVRSTDSIQDIRTRLASAPRKTTSQFFRGKWLIVGSIESILLAAEADTAAYSGYLAKAREFSQRAVFTAERVDEKESAGYLEAIAALRESLFGNTSEAKQRAAAAPAAIIGA